MGRKDLKAEVHDTGTRARALGGHLEPEDYTILRAAVHALIGNVVYGELRRHGMQHADAKDHASEVVCTVGTRIFSDRHYKKWFGTPNDKVSPEGHVMRCARNGLRDRLRKVKRLALHERKHPMISIEADEERTSADGDALPGVALVAPGLSVERAMHVREQIDALRAAFTDAEIALMMAEMSADEYAAAGYAADRQQAYSHRYRCLKRAKKLLERRERR